MRPKNQKGRRWYHFARSPGHEGRVQWNLFVSAARQLLKIDPLPGGLKPVRYWRRHAKIVDLFEEHVQQLIREQEKEENRAEEAAAAFNEPAQITELIKPNIDSRIILDTSVALVDLISKIKNAPELLHEVDHRKFEELVAYVFERLGYEVELTSRTRDKGRDIVAVKNQYVNVKYIIECKHWSNNKVGIAPVRALYGVKVDEGATKAIMATTSYLTKEARLFVERHRWELEAREYDKIIEWVRSI